MNISAVQLQVIQDSVKLCRELVEHEEVYAILDGLDVIQQTINEVRNAPQPMVVTDTSFGHSRPAPKPPAREKKRR